MIKKISLSLLFIFITTCIFSQALQIGLFQSYQLNSLSITLNEGKYAIYADGEFYAIYKQNSSFYISRKLNKIVLRDKKNTIGEFEKIEFQSKSEDCLLSLKPINPNLKTRIYEGNITIIAKEDKLLAVNKTDMEKYIASVIEAEGGSKADIEYYKAQAVLIRTYAIKNMFRHAEEGFNLCDDVHCQAFNGKSMSNPNIYKAAQSTMGKVVIDADSNLIVSPFHANCGGITCRAGMYWQKDLPYLLSVKDPFCTMQNHANWRIEIDRSLWNSYLIKKGYTQEEVSAFKPDLDFNYRRKSIDIAPNKPITMRSIREDFKLKSSFFTIELTVNKVIFNGKGYGHGIGLCQEGAMEMAKVGYSWLDIIHFYFTNISIVDYRDLELDQY